MFSSLYKKSVPFLKLPIVSKVKLRIFHLKEGRGLGVPKVLFIKQTFYWLKTVYMRGKRFRQ